MRISTHPTTPSTLLLREREYAIERIDRTDTGTTFFAVRDVATGLVLTEHPLATAPDTATVLALLDQLAEDLDADQVAPVFSSDLLRLAEAAGRAFVIEGRWISVRPSRRHRRPTTPGWDLLENTTVLTHADPYPSAPTREQARSFLSARKQRLDRLIAALAVTAGPDGRNEQLYRLLHGVDPAPRYLAIGHDATGAVLSPADTAEQARAVLAVGPGNGTGARPDAIHDLDTGIPLSAGHHCPADPFQARPRT